MSFKAGIGFSNHPDPLVAVKDAAKQAKDQLKRERIDVTLVFNSPHYDPNQFLPALFNEIGQSRVVGCTSSEIILADSLEPVGIGVLYLTSDQIKFGTGQVSHLPLQDLRAAGKTFMRNCSPNFGPAAGKLMLFFIDGMIDSPFHFLDGIKEALGQNIVIIGAGSNASGRAQKTNQYHYKEILSSAACGFIWGGQCQMGASYLHGWKPLGQPRMITAVQGTSIQTIDRRKAVTIYEDLFQSKIPSWDKERLDTISLRYPLGVRDPDQGYVVRNIVTKLDDGTLVCQDKVKEGALVHIMMGSKRSCLQETEQSAYQVREQLAGVAPKLILIVESYMRRSLLGRYAVQEIRLIRSVLGERTPLIGICSQRELFTISSEKSSEMNVHNSSLVIMAIG